MLSRMRGRYSLCVRRCARLILFFLFAVTSAHPQVKLRDCRLVEQVWRRLIVLDDVRTGPPGYGSWPPQIAILIDKTSDPGIRASCAVEVVEDPKVFGEIGGFGAFSFLQGSTPIVRITPKFLEMAIQGDENRLAMVLGHELGHIVHKHVLRGPYDANVIELAFSREEELDADTEGMLLALAAGFSKNRALKVYQWFEENLGYCSFHALRKDHPSDQDRLANLDVEQRTLWRAMSAFANGVVFLDAQQYAAAERCFREVKREFRRSYN